MSEIQIKQLGAKWETQIKKGNCYFQSAVFEDAYPHYMQAMVVSELFLENVTTVPKHNSLHLPGMYFTSCINIACNYWKMQDLKNAADYFLYCTYECCF